MDGRACARDAEAKLSPPPGGDAWQWASGQFGQADLGDARRELRLLRLAAAMLENPHMSLPKQFGGGGAELAGAYRFLSNPEIDPQEILAPHTRLVRQQAQAYPVVLCVQDDTDLDYTGRSGIRGLGQLGDGTGRGLLQHSALAVLPEGQVLGLLDVAWHALAPAPRGETLRQRQRRWNLVDVWQEAVEHIGPWEAAGMLVQVGDRHADLFRHLALARQAGHHFVVRATHDRHVDQHTARLWAKATAQPPLGRITVPVGAQRDHRGRLVRQGREAVLTIRATAVLLPPPSNDPRTADWTEVRAWAIHLREEHPPAGLPQQEVVEWMLLSSLEVADLAAAVRVVGYYTRRWVIEEWHRCYKQGCQIEASQLDDAQDLQRLSAILCVVAVRLLQLRDLADERHPQAQDPQALRQLVPPLYIEVVAKLCQIPVSELTPRQFFLQVARQGGYLGRKNDPRPGWIVLWRGWYDLSQMVRGIAIYQALHRPPATDV